MTGRRRSDLQLTVTCSIHHSVPDARAFSPYLASCARWIVLCSRAVFLSIVPRCRSGGFPGAFQLRRAGQSSPLVAGGRERALLTGRCQRRSPVTGRCKLVTDQLIVSARVTGHRMVVHGHWSALVAAAARQTMLSGHTLAYSAIVGHWSPRVIT